MVRFASLFNVKERTVTFISGTTYSLEALRSMGMGDLLGTMFDFSEKLNALELSSEELGLFTAVVLVSAGRLHISVKGKVSKLKTVIVDLPIRLWLIFEKPESFLFLHLKSM